MQIDEETFKKANAFKMLIKHEGFKMEIKTHTFCIYIYIFILCFLSRGWETHVFQDGYNSAANCSDE